MVFNLIRYMSTPRHSTEDMGQCTVGWKRDFTSCCFSYLG